MSDNSLQATTPQLRWERCGVLTFVALFAFLGLGAPDGGAERWADLGWTLASLITGVKCLGVARVTHDRPRLTWQLFGAGCLTWFAGMLAWDWLRYVEGRALPFPALPDVAFLVFAPLFLAGFLFMDPYRGGVPFRMLQVSKAGILFCCFIMALILAPLVPLERHAAAPLYFLTALLYPALYGAVLAFGLLRLAPHFGRASFRPLLLVMAGFGIHTLTVTWYARDLLTDDYQIGSVLDIFWLVGFGAIYWGALEQQRLGNRVRSDQPPPEHAVRLDAVVPIAGMLMLIGVGFAFRHNLRMETVYYLLPFVLLLVGFLALREWATQVYENNIKQALRDNERRLGTLVDTLPYGVQESDCDGLITFSNAAHHRILGYPPGALIGRHLWDVLGEEAEKEEFRRYLQYLVANQPPPTPYRGVNRRCDGTAVQVQVVWDYRRDALGRLLGFIAVITDITETEHAQEKLRQAAAVFGNTSEAVVVTDAAANIVAVNQAFCGITGFAEEEVLGENPRILRSDRHDAAFYARMWASLHDTGVWRGEIWDRRKNGEVFPAWEAISAIRDSEGRIANYVSVFSDISALKQSQERLDFLAYHDPLTNLPNRLLFEDRLGHALARAAREDRSLALLFMDLDRFKNINDSLGHPVGDCLLIESAQRLTALARTEDTVARLGGDEFILIMEDIDDAQDAAVLAQKLVGGFEQPIIAKGHELHVTLSIGVGVYPRDGDDVATLVKNADTALYRAKAEGRNGFRFYTEALTASVQERLQLETDLRRALANRELVLHYQPQVSLTTGRYIGAEALLRWAHPQRGLVPPDRFIPLAEETGLIVPIGEWVLREACTQAQAWRDAGVAIGVIAVNVSGIQFQREGIVDTVRRALADSGLPPQCLELEITENFIMEKAERAIDVLKELAGLGVTLAIDDFGTGYSSLSYLKRLPIHKLKIDRSFVRDIPQDANDAAIARAVIALGRSLGLKVIAEGVETPEQQAFLLSEGCHEAQGYLYSRPLAAPDLQALV